MKLDWLVESIAQKTAVDCEKFKYSLNSGKSNVDDEQATAPSPASKRNILLMSGQSSKQATPKRLNFDSTSMNNSMADKNQSLNNDSLKSQDTAARPEDDIIDQYLKAPPPKEPTVQPVEPEANTSSDVFKIPAQPQPNIQSTAQSDITDFESESEFSVSINNQVLFLANLKIFIKGFDPESHESLVEDCKIAGAEVIEDDNYKGTVDFLILPVDAITMDGINITAKNIVNHNWLVSISNNNYNEKNSTKVFKQMCFKIVRFNCR